MTATPGPSPIIEPDDPDLLAALQLCSRNPSSLLVTELGFTNLDAYEHEAPTHDIINVGEGQYAATAAEWEYRLPAEAAVDLGSIVSIDEITIARFYVLLDASKSSIRLLELTAVGSGATMDRVLEMGLSSLNPSEPIEVRFSIRGE